MDLNADRQLVQDTESLFPPLDEQQAPSQSSLTHETAKIDTLVAKKRLLLERLAEYRTALITRTVTKGLTTASSQESRVDPEPAAQTVRGGMARGNAGALGCEAQVRSSLGLTSARTEVYRRPDSGGGVALLGSARRTVAVRPDDQTGRNIGSVGSVRAAAQGYRYDLANHHLTNFIALEVESREMLHDPVGWRAPIVGTSLQSTKLGSATCCN